MREIKFRAWDEKSKSFVENCVLAQTDRKLIAYSNDAEMRELKLQEYTGLKDKNGKEIFEGDILKVENINVPLIPVVWDDLDAAFNVHYNIRAVVIGNIYENPELLERMKK